MARRRPQSSSALLPLLACAAVAVASVAATAQDPVERERVSAKSARQINTELGPTQILEGDVRIDRSDLTLTSERAQRYPLLRSTTFFGSVHAVGDSFELWADTLQVDEASERAHARGTVRVELEDGSSGTARRGRYWRAQDQLALIGSARVLQGGVAVSGDSIHVDQRLAQLESFGGVQIIDEVNETVVDGEHAVMDQVSGRAVVDSLPRLRTRQRGGSTLNVESNWMLFERNPEHSRAVGDVSFRQALTVATADTADFFGEDLLVLTGTPEVEQGPQRIRGDRIQFHYLEGDLERIEVYGNAQLIDSTPDTLARRFRSIPLANELHGDTLIIKMTASEISHTRVRGNARSIYLPEDQTDNVSVNEVSGHAVDIHFEQGRVGRVEVDQGVSGSFRFVETRALRAALTDSLQAAQPDTSESARGAPGTVDFAGRAQSVDYVGDHATFYIGDGRIHIAGKAEVRHGTMNLVSHDIYYDTTEGELLAEGDPLLADGSQELIGDRMGYLFDASSGAVTSGGTRYDDGFYTGKHIRRLGDESLLVRGGTFTSCDRAQPHYHFRAKRMKLKLGENIVARQVTFVVSDLPLITLPFYFKSLDSGRHSGILFPNVNVGFSSRTGRYIRDLGYYWATNDYTDFTFEMDYNERRDLTLSVRNNYNIRYGPSGNAEFSFQRNLTDSQRGNLWQLSASHRQPELWDVWSASARVEASSSTLDGDLRQQSSALLNPTQLRSTGSLARSFGNGARLSLSVTRDQFVNQRDDDPLTNRRLLSQTLPQFSLSFRSGPVLSALPRGEEGSFLGNILRETTFGHSYGGQATRAVTENGRDLTYTGNGRWTLSYNPLGRIGPFAFTSGANFSANYRRVDSQLDVYTTVFDTTFVDPDSTMVVEERVVLDESRTSLSDDITPSLSITNRLSTDLYGVFRTKLGPIRGIRHKVSYSMDHSFRPQLGDQQEMDQSFNFSLVNELSVKIPQGGGAGAGGSAAETDAGDPAEAEPALRKLDQLIRWSLNTSYDPDNDPGERWSNIRSNVRIRPGVTQAISFDWSQTFDPRNFDILDSSITTGLRLSGGLDLGGNLVKDEPRLNPIVDRVAAPTDSTQVEEEVLRDALDYGFGDPRSLANLEPSTDRNRVGWSLTTNATFRSDQNGTRRSTLSTSAQVQLPGQWRVGYDMNYDVEAGDFTRQSFTVNRDLHCWSVQFRRSLAGRPGLEDSGSEFGFRLYLRQIPQVEVTSGERDIGSLSRFSQF